jgi:hypothetical protein
LRARQLALRDTRQRTLAHHVERATGLADRAHRVVDAPAAQAHLRDHEAPALRAQHVVGRHAHVVEAHVTVRGGLLGDRSRRCARSRSPGVSLGTMNIDMRW